jgi:hypothetical protein
MASKMMFILQIIALWLAVFLLVALTSAALIASSARSDCGTHINTTMSLSMGTCTLQENISASVHHHASYFQSTHIIIVQGIAACALLVSKPSLWDMTWSALEGSASTGTVPAVPMMKAAALQDVVELTNSPGIFPAVLYAKSSRSLSHPIILVILISVLSLLSPIALSPVYQSHNGPYSVTATLVVGGGIGIVVSNTFSFDDFVSSGEVAGRAIINAASATNTQIPLVTFNTSVAPFIPWNAIGAIWKTQVETVVAHNLMDCGSSAPSRLTSSQEIVTIVDPNDYFAANGKYTQRMIPSFAGQLVGVFPNDPQVSAVYLNSTTTVQPGAVQAQSSVIFLAANGTLEGAQQRITSPDPTSRIMFVDVLVCTSTTTLEISTCSIDDGNVTSCVPVPSANLPSSALTSDTGGVENYITNPEYVATLLSASATTANYDIQERIPMYDRITPDMIASKIPPISFLNVNTTMELYNISLSYITDVLSSQTAQGLVQGLVSTYPVSSTQQVFIISTFGTSNPVLLYVILVLSIACALSSTLASTLTQSVRRAAPLDLMRIIAISRNPQLDGVFGVYSDRSVEIDEDMLDARVGYMWVESLRRRALVLAHGAGASGDTVYKTVDSDFGIGSSIGTSIQPRDRLIGYEDVSPRPYTS